MSLRLLTGKHPLIGVSGAGKDWLHCPNIFSFYRIKICACWISYSLVPDCDARPAIPDAHSVSRLSSSREGSQGLCSLLWAATTRRTQGHLARRYRIPGPGHFCNAIWAGDKTVCTPPDNLPHGGRILWHGARGFDGRETSRVWLRALRRLLFSDEQVMIDSAPSAAATCTS